MGEEDLFLFSMLFGKPAKPKFEGRLGVASPPPPRAPHRARFRKYGAYVIQGLREMTGGLCIMVKNDVLFRVVGL